MSDTRRACAVCKLPFKTSLSWLTPWKLVVRQFCNGIYCVTCAANHFESLGHGDVAEDIRRVFGRDAR